MEVGAYQNQINDLQSISNERYENIFKIYNVDVMSSNYRFIIF